MVTPSGYVRETETRETPFRFVDGGYYENSGAATALDVINGMMTLRNDPNARKFFPVPILIGYRSLAARAQARRQSRGPEELEFFSPARTLYRSRDGRGTDAVYQLRYAMRDIVEREIAQVIELANAGTESAQEELQFLSGLPDSGLPVEITLGDEEMEIPLGWSLSQSARTALRRQIEKPTNPAGWRLGDPSVGLQRVRDWLRPQIPVAAPNDDVGPAISNGRHPKP
jgi:hypothetical protein